MEVHLHDIYLNEAIKKADASLNALIRLPLQMQKQWQTWHTRVSFSLVA